MFSSKLKSKIAWAVESMLRGINDAELPNGQVSFLLHVNGKDPISWANISPNWDRDVPVPEELKRNTDYE